MLVTGRAGHALPVVRKMDKIKMLVLTYELRQVSWLIQEIGLRCLHPPSVWMEWQVVMPKSPQGRAIYIHRMGDVLNSERMWS